MTNSAQSVPRDPLRTFQFRVGIRDDAGAATVTWVAGVRKVSGLSASISAFEVWEGGNNLHRYAHPDKVTWEAVTLEQGLALDDTLEIWARAVLDFSMRGHVVNGPRNSADLVPLKRNVVIDVWDPLFHPRSGRPPPTRRTPTDGQTNTAVSWPPERKKRFVLINAWVSKYNALPPLDSMSSEVGLVSLELQHEGFVREDLPDASVPAPAGTFAP